MSSEVVSETAPVVARVRRINDMELMGSGIGVAHPNIRHQLLSLYRRDIEEIYCRNSEQISRWDRALTP